MVYFLLFPLNFSSYISGPLRALGSFSYWPRGEIAKRVILGAGTCVIQQWSELALYNIDRNTAQLSLPRDKSPRDRTPEDTSFPLDL